MALIFFFVVSTLCGVVRCASAEGGPPRVTNEVEDNSRYKTLEANATLFKLLVNNKTGVSRSEVFDMLHSRDDNPDHMNLPTFPQDNDDVNPDVAFDESQAEYLQATGSKVDRDDKMRVTSGVEDIGDRPRGEPVGMAAAIMVGITCTVVCAAYVTLIVWRRIDMKRNGLKHELLRNEDNIAETRIEL